MSGRDVQFVSTLYVATGRMGEARGTIMGEARGTMMAKMKFAITTDVSSAL